MPPLLRIFRSTSPVQAHLCHDPAGHGLSAPPNAGPDPIHPLVSVGRGRPAITNRCTHARPIPHCRGRQSGEVVHQFLTCHPALFSGGAL